MQQVTKLNFNAFNILSFSTLNSAQPSLCFNWTITLQYKFTALSHIDALLGMDSTYCKNGGTNQKATSRRDRLALTEDEPVRRTMRGTATNTYAEGPFGLNLWILHFMVLILALTSLYLSWHYIYRMGVMYMHVRANKSKTFLRKATINKVMMFLYTSQQL